MIPRLAILVIPLAIGCRGPQAAEGHRSDSAPRLQAADSIHARVDNTFVFELPDTGGFIVNGVAIRQDSIPPNLAALFERRAAENRAVMVKDNPRRRNDAQWLDRAARAAGGRAFDLDLSGWPTPAQ